MSLGCFFLSMPLSTCVLIPGLVAAHRALCLEKAAGCGGEERAVLPGSWLAWYCRLS